MESGVCAYAASDPRPPCLSGLPSQDPAGRVQPALAVSAERVLCGQAHELGSPGQPSRRSAVPRRLRQWQDAGAEAGEGERPVAPSLRFSVWKRE